MRLTRRIDHSEKRRTDEVLVLPARSEWRFCSPVAGKESRGSGDSMVVGSPHELDGIADRGIDREGDVAKDTLSGGDNDGVGRTRADIANSVGRCRWPVGGWWATMCSHTLWSHGRSVFRHRHREILTRHAIVIARDSMCAAGAMRRRTVVDRRRRLVRRRRAIVDRRRLVRRRRAVVDRRRLVRRRRAVVGGRRRRRCSWCSRRRWRRLGSRR